MASPMRKSGIPVIKSTGPKTQLNGGPSQTGSSQVRSSSIPIKKPKNVTVSPTKAASSGPSAAKECELEEEIKRLENEVQGKDSAINDLNEKLMERMRECQVLREENEAARENLNLSNHEVPPKIKDLEKLLNEKETFIEDMLTKKRELERKFEVEQDMLKNQHEVEVLSLQQRLEDAHQEILEEVETNLKNEKLTSGRLREELKGVRNQGASAEINILHEELMNTKLRYENAIFDLKQNLETEKSEKETLVLKHENERKEIESIKEKHREEMETLKYLVQEKDILINELKMNVNSEDVKSQDIILYSEEDITRKIDELRRELTTEHEHNLELANELWRKKFEEHQSTDPRTKTRENDEDKVLDGDEEHEDKNNQNSDKFLDEISVV